MPILSYYNNMWYGSASAAMVDATGESEVEVAIKGYASPPLSVTITPPTPYVKATRLVNSPLVVQGEGIMEKALPKARGRMALDVRINQLSQDDVTGAVLEAQVENGLTLKQAMRVILSVLSGKTTITPGENGAATVTFRDINDTKTRVTANMSGSERESISLDIN